MRLIYYWTIALWTLVTSTYGLGFVDDELLDKKCKPNTWLWKRWRPLAALVVCKLCLKLVAKQQGRTFIDYSSLFEILKFLALPQERQQAFSCTLRRRKHKTQTNRRTRDTRKVLKTTMTYLIIIYRSASDHHHRTIDSASVPCTACFN